MAAASPGYFTTTFVNGIKTETTSTRRAGLIRFTYPSSANSTFVVVDLTHDLQRSFEGGTVTLNSSTARVMLTGTFLQVRMYVNLSHSYSYVNYRAMELATILSMHAMISSLHLLRMLNPWLHLVFSKVPHHPQPLSPSRRI